MTPEIKALAGDQQRSRFMEKALADLLAIHDRFLTAIENHTVSVKEVKEYANSIQDHAERITTLPPGEKGDSIKGDPGESVDFEAVVAEVLNRIPKPENGKDSNPDLIATRVITRLKQDKKDTQKESIIDIPAIIEAVIGHLKDNKVLTKEHINGLDGELSSYRNQLAGKHYGKDTWARGGGDTVTAGSNVTITQNANGQKVISASGGGASTPLTPTGDVDGMNTIFGVLSQPSSVVADGITYFEGAGYSYAALNITMDVPPSQYIRYYA